MTDKTARAEAERAHSLLSEHCVLIEGVRKQVGPANLYEMVKAFHESYTTRLSAMEQSVYCENRLRIDDISHKVNLILDFLNAEEVEIPEVPARPAYKKIQKVRK